MAQQTAVEILFLEFEALSESSKKAGDIQLANLIDFLCERKQVALNHEYQIIESIKKEYFMRGFNHAIDVTT